MAGAAPNNSTVLNLPTMPTQTTPLLQMTDKPSFITNSWWIFLQNLYLRVSSIGRFFTASASGVSLVSGTDKTITSIQLPIGNWLVQGTVQFSPAGTTQVTSQIAGISTTNNTLDAGLGKYTSIQNSSPVGVGDTFSTPVVRLTINTPITIYVIARCNFTVSTCTASATITINAI